MALTVAQFEEIAALLREVPALVDGLESRRPGFAEQVLRWLRRAESSLENNRIAAASHLSACRAMLIEAGRGVHHRSVVLVGRPTPRKLREASAGAALERANEVLHGVISPREATFRDAERIARQLAVVAEAKGFVRACRDAGGHQDFLRALQQRIASDADLASAHAHLLAIVGRNDLLVFLDRALGPV